METITLENGNEMALGTISEGTLREQDLVPAFLSTLRVVCPECWETANDEIPDAALSDDDGLSVGETMTQLWEEL
jgi:hypothetical protein